MDLPTEYRLDVLRHWNQALDREEQMFLFRFSHTIRVKAGTRVVARLVHEILDRKPDMAIPAETYLDNKTVSRVKTWIVGPITKTEANDIIGLRRWDRAMLALLWYYRECNLKIAIETAISRYIEKYGLSPNCIVFSEKLILDQDDRLEIKKVLEIAFPDLALRGDRYTTTGYFKLCTIDGEGAENSGVNP